MSLLIYDDKSDPKLAIDLYEKLITEDKVDAVMGPYGSTHTEAVAPFGPGAFAVEPEVVDSGLG